MDDVSGWPLAADILVYNEVLLGRASLNRLPVAIAVWRPDGAPLFANRRLQEWLGIGENALPGRDAFWQGLGLSRAPDEDRGEVRIEREGTLRLFRYHLDTVRNLEGQEIADAVYLVPAAVADRRSRLDDPEAESDGPAPHEPAPENLCFMLVNDGCLASWTALTPRWPDMGAWLGESVDDALDHLEEEAAMGRIPHFSTHRYRLSDGAQLVQVRAAAPDALPATSLGSDRLIAATAHEIRNPLATIRGFLQILPGAAQGDRERYAAIAVREVDRIVDVVNEFLQGPGGVAESGPPVDLAAVVRGTVAGLQEDIDRKGVAVTLRTDPAPVWVEGHPTRLHQVATNLIRNALDAVPAEGGEVVVEVQTEGIWARLAVDDNGPGIPEEWAADVFDPAFTRRQGGHGLGLAITRWIVTMYRGHIGVGRSASGGARFEVHLPVLPHGAGTDDETPAAYGQI